ncbi:unnamed protein product [Dibothriocephalus latus]|uniref:Uncharacterized protein n=1 Tax=Dibothriocephalus latus TaxID=60516 RepID=A0A3P7M7L2_DIBLA|nr:unnamed protein product [Dibothriocephalus latus]
MHTCFPLDSESFDQRDRVTVVAVTRACGLLLSPGCVTRAPADKLASFDVNGNDENPHPRYVERDYRNTK